ncbi:MAG: alpha-amylase [Planctomycetes bacterium]|nr:alpha-amylase [Planctomycetota bacterium]
MTSHLYSDVFERLHARFRRLYGEEADTCLRRLQMLIGRYGVGYSPGGLPHRPQRRRWSEKDAILVTYGNSIVQPTQNPLVTLGRFLVERLKTAVSAVHILPFFPYSSDDGFAVIDYREVNPELGTWSAIHSIGRHFDLMFDLVLNHVSSKSKWFRNYASGVAPHRDYFIEPPPEADLSQVVRPRSQPLLRSVQTHDGVRHVWATFSFDQIDLNFANPDVLFEFLDILFLYISHGVRIIRLDAIAYLWKRIGTPCIHLSETHEVVKILRDVLDLVAPSVLLLTETNVPHSENVSYFGAGDEAHAVYQFSLPPLLLHALHSGRTTFLTRWAQSLDAPPAGCTYLNFTASHDGIGVRPLEGLVPEEEMALLYQRIAERGGQVSHKRNADGSESPYELNTTYFDALSEPARWGSPLHQRRFLCSQTLAMELQGVPAIYIHSLTATRNDYVALDRTGHPRAINRHVWDGGEINALLDNPSSVTSRIFNEYVRRLHIRRSHPAFHPDSQQKVLEAPDRLFAVLRTDPESGETLLCVNNISSRSHEFCVDAALFPSGCSRQLVDLLKRHRRIEDNRTLLLKPYDSAWLTFADST